MQAIIGVQEFHFWFVSWFYLPIKKMKGFWIIQSSIVKATIQTLNT